MALSSHIRKIEKRTTIARSDIEKGMIIQCTYRKKKDKRGVERTKRYMFLVLDPDHNGYMHCLSLEKILPRAVETFAEDVGVVQTEVRGISRLNITQLLLEGNSKRLYNEVIKRNLGTGKFDASYRTIIPSKMTAVKVVNYKYPETVNIIVE